MPTYPNNKLDTSITDVLQEPSEGIQVEQPDLELLKLGGDSFSGKQSVAIEQDPWTAFESFQKGVGTSIIGTAVRVGMESDFDTGLTQMTWNNGMTYVPDDDDKKMILDSGLPADAFHAVLKNVHSKEDLKARFDVVLQNTQIQKEAESQGLKQNIFMGLGDAIGDPTSYVTFGAGTAVNTSVKGAKILNSQLARRLVESTATTYVSEKYLRNQITGQEEDVTSALIGSAIMVSGLHGIGKGWEAATRRINSSETARNSTGVKDPTFMGERGEATGTRETLDDDMEVLESGRVISRGIIDDEPRTGAERRTSGRFWQRDVASTAMDDPETAPYQMFFDIPTQGLKGEYTQDGYTIGQLKRNLDDRDNEVFALWEDYVDYEYERGYALGIYSDKSDVDKRFETLLDYHDQLDMSQLSEADMQMLKAVQEYNVRHRELAKNPSMLGGREGTPPVHDRFIEDDNFRTRMFNRVAINEFIAKMGNFEAAQRMFADAIKKGFDEDFNTGRKDWNTKQIAEKYATKNPETGEMEVPTEITPEMLDKYAMDYAFGVLKNKSDEAVYDTDMFEGAAARNTDHFKQRMNIPFHGEVTLPDGTLWSPFEIEYHNFGQKLRSYSNSVNGQIAVNAATGKHIEDFGAEIANLADGKGKEALLEQLKVVSGHACQKDFSKIDFISDSLRDVTFSVTNGMMGFGNLMEVFGNMHNKGVVPAALKNISKAMGKDLKKIVGMKPAELQRNFTTMVVGRALTQRMNLTRQDYTRGIMERLGGESTGNKAIANARWAAAQAADVSPFSRTLRYMHEGLIDAGNEAAMTGLLTHARGGKGSKMLTDKFLKSHNIPKAQAERALEVLREVPQDVDATGELGDFDVAQWMNDPRVSDVIRLVHAFNDEVMMKSDNLGQMTLKPNNWFMRLVMQFKRFATVSTQYAVRNIADIGQIGRVDKFVGFLIGGGLGAAYMVGSTGYKATMIDNDYERKKYLEDNMSLDKIAAGALKRHPLLAGWSLAYDMAGGILGAPYAGLGKTTYENVGESFEYTGKASSAWNFQNSLIQHGMGMIPAARVGFSAGSALTNLSHLGMDLIDDEHLLYNQEQQVLKGLSKDIRTFVPNNPTTRKWYDDLMKSFGVTE